MQLFKPNVEKLAEKKDLDGLGKALQYKDASVRQAAAAALDKLGLPEDPCVRAWHAVVKQDWPRAVQAGVDAIPALSLSLRDPQEVVRTGAAMSLGMISPEHSIPVLVEALKEADEGVRQAASGTLAALGSQAAGPVAALLEAKNEPTWRSAFHALRAMGPSAYPEVCQVIRKGSKTARPRAVGIMILDASPDAVNALIEILRDPDPQVASLVAYCLGKIGDARATGALVELMNDMSYQPAKTELRALLDGTSDNPRVQAYCALTKLGPAAAEACKLAQEHEDLEVRLAGTLFTPKEPAPDA